MKPSVVVFDIGGVLVNWQPHLAWMEEFRTREAVDAFMERIDFASLNRRADGGEAFADLARELPDPEDRRRLEGYVADFARTVIERVPGTWGLVDRLRARGVPLHAITNWSAETWTEGLKAHPALGEIFGVAIVSGREQVQKPELAIFELLSERAEVPASSCVFVDDSTVNVKGARSAGMDAIHFTGAQALESELAKRGLL